MTYETINNLSVSSPSQLRAQTLLQAALRALQSRDLQRAISACKELNEKFPAFAAGWSVASQVALKIGNADKALDYCNNAIALDAKQPAYYLARAKVQQAFGDYEQAAVDALQAANSCGDQAALLDQVSSFLSTYCNRHEEALSLMQRAVELEPENAVFQFNLGSVLRFTGNVSGAEKAWDRCIELDPDYYEAYMTRSELKKQTPQNNHVEAIRQKINAGTKTWLGQSMLSYAVAKEYEDLENYSASFEWMRRGAEVRRKHLQYDLSADLRTIDSIMEKFCREFFQTAKVSHQNDKPIFIVGMPRTGTTLVERILSSHSHVNAGGELNFFAQELIRLIQAQVGRRKLESVELVQASAKVDFAELGRGYIDSCKAYIASELRFTDKLPLNFLYCGLIHRALPNAKIIHVIRHPYDTCLGMYKRLFRTAYPMSYDLEELAQYYIAYCNLMQHWNSVLPGVIHEFRYESLVSEQEAETYRLLDYCELEWQDDCLHFERNPQPTTTASAIQVRQSLYKTAIGNWKNYANFLTPLIEVLKQNGIDAAGSESW